MCNMAPPSGRLEGNFDKGEQYYTRKLYIPGKPGETYT